MVIIEKVMVAADNMKVTIDNKLEKNACSSL